MSDNALPYPDVVKGVGGVVRVVQVAVAAIVPLRQRHAQLRVDVLHELASVMHRLANKSKEDLHKKKRKRRRKKTTSSLEQL